MKASWYNGLYKQEKLVKVSKSKKNCETAVGQKKCETAVCKNL